ALMGPSGCGKTSALGVLAGREPARAVVSCVFVCSMCVCVYVPQDDIVRESLTVFENIWFSAALRLPDGTAAARREAIVQQTIETLGLTAVAHARVGSADRRGISGGQ
ncbi:hypothetical protein T492DRAFT_560883, partial [Pavlovales sp. CCMP2436]